MGHSVGPTHVKNLIVIVDVEDTDDEEFHMKLNVEDQVKNNETNSV